MIETQIITPNFNIRRNIDGVRNNNNKDTLIANWNCNTTGGINGEASCSGKLKIIITWIMVISTNQKDLLKIIVLT